MAPNNRQSPSNDDADLSLEDWMSKSREALVLNCNSLNLPSSGSAAALAQRLHEYHNPPEPHFSDSSPSGQEIGVRKGRRLSSSGSDTDEVTDDNDDEEVDAGRRNKFEKERDDPPPHQPNTARGQKRPHSHNTKAKTKLPATTVNKSTLPNPNSESTQEYNDPSALPTDTISQEDLSNV